MTIAPYFKAIAQENDMKLLNESEKNTTYSEFNPEILLNADKADRYATYAIGIRNGIITRNEVRELENLETLDGLDEILQESGGVMTTEQADNQFVYSEVKEDDTTTEESENEITDDVTALMIQKIKADKNLSDKDRSDALSHLGRISGLVKTSAKTSKEKV